MEKTVGNPLEQQHITVTGNSGAKITIRFSDLVEWTNEGIYCVNSRGIVVYANERFCKNLGYDTSEVIDKEIFNFIYGDENVKLSKAKLDLRKKGISDTYDIAMKKKDGEAVWMRMSGRPIIDDTGEFMGTIAISSEIGRQRRLEEELITAKDDLETKVIARTRQLSEANQMLNDEIKERRLAEISLKNSEKRFRDIYNNSPDAIFIESVDGKILDVNDAACKLHEATKEELLGKTIFDLSPERIHAKILQHQPQIITGGLQKFESECLSMTGNIIPVEISAAIIDFKDQLALLMHVRDISDRKRNEELLQKLNVELEAKVNERTKELQLINAQMQLEIAEKEKVQVELKNSVQLYREIARNLPKAAMFIFDKNMKYILAEGPLVGIISQPKAEIEGRTVTDSIRQSERERVEQIYRKILDGESSESEQTFLERSLKVYHMPIHNEAGDIIYGMVMVFDISDLKNVQVELEKRATQLQRSNEELERFAYVSSHDLQGPLRTIASYLQLLELRYKSKLDPEALEFIDFSVKGAKRMQQIILDLLNYSKLSSVHKPFVKTDTGEIIKTVLKTLDSSIKGSGAEIIVSDMHEITAEPSQLYQLFQNLIDNAIKFVKDKKPVIKVFSIEHKSHWEFMVSDNGIGIKDEYQEKIFQIFQRLHSISEYAGTGIGLAICQRIVQLHGGKIWFVSKPGEGTTFHFTISKNLIQGK